MKEKGRNNKESKTKTTSEKERETHFCGLRELGQEKIDKRLRRRKGRRRRHKEEPQQKSEGRKMEEEKTSSRPDQGRFRLSKRGPTERN
jgi:hypothetical protein